MLTPLLIHTSVTGTGVPEFHDCRFQILNAKFPGVAMNANANAIAHEID